MLLPTLNPSRISTDHQAILYSGSFISSAFTVAGAVSASNRIPIYFCRGAIEFQLNSHKLFSLLNL